MREFLNSAGGKAVAAILILILFALAGWQLYSSLGGSEISKISRDRVFMDATTGKTFEYTLKIGDKIPVAAPSGGKTGYPTEECWWTKDGKVRTTPFYVLLNAWTNKPGPTICPDCGRLVVARNPSPSGNTGKPPPTAEEMKGSNAAQ